MNKIEITEKLSTFSSVWQAELYIKTLYPAYQKKPIKPMLAHGANSKDVLKYGEDLHEYDIAIKMHQVKADKYREETNELNDIFIEYIKKESGFYNVPEKYQVKLWDFAWEEGGGFGFTEVYNYLERLVNIFR